MRLKSLKIEGYDVLRDFEIAFSPTVENESDGFDIDFLVGLNGSGKSTILRLISEIFVRLEGASGEQNIFPFRFSISYVLKVDGRLRTIMITNQKTDASDNHPMPSKLQVFLDPNSGAPEKVLYDNKFLPTSIVVMTTGNEREWRRIQSIGSMSKEDQPLQALLKRSPTPLTEGIAPRHGGSTLGATDVSSKTSFVWASQLPLVMLCGLIAHHSSAESASVATGGGFSDALKQSGIEGLKGFSLRFKIQDPIADLNPTLRRLFEACRPTRALRLGDERLLVFDFLDSTAEHARRISDEFSGPHQLFLALSRLSDHEAPGANLLQEVNIFLKRAGRPVEAAEVASRSDRKAMAESAPLHLFSWLSDGEQSFLSRMALLTLVKTTNALVLLDEPEVHFNDYWKRHIVNLIFQTLTGTDCHVIVTTHSSIALTDVPSRDIVKIVRTGTQTSGHSRDVSIATLGADPGDIMIHVFDTQYATGQRAVDRITGAIPLGAVPNVLQRQSLEKLKLDVAPGYWSYLIRRALQRVGPAAN